MKTEHLIRALAADSAAPQPSLRRWIPTGLGIGFAAALVVFAWKVKPRPDLAEAAAEPRFLLKFAVTLSLAAAAFGLLLRLIRPGLGAGLWGAALLVGPSLLAIGVTIELGSVPAAAWEARMVGSSARFCLTTIPLLAAPILAALFIVLRDGAPTRPALAGAVAGLVAGGLGAGLYAAHCIDDSPLFVMAWYSLAIALVTAVGGLAGSRLLRW